MLEEYKNLYKSCADEIKDWQKLSKNELCFKYIEIENDSHLANCYFSCIVCAYWNLIGKFHSACYNVTTPEDCYEWLIDSITYTLKHRKWLDKDSSIYNDPHGPDKMINRCMKCRRLTFYQFLNRQKRKDDFVALSLDEIHDEYEDNSNIFTDLQSSINPNEIPIIDFIRTTFDKKDYFLTFMLDFICFGNVFMLNPQTGYYVFNQCRFIKKFKIIDDEYLQAFAERYHISFTDAKKVYVKYLQCFNADDIKQRIDFNFKRLKHTKYFKELLQK